MLEMNKSIVLELEENSNYKLENLLCWEKKENEFSFYIFSIQVKDNTFLREEWKKVNNIIATYFQSNLIKSIELWNIYLFFFLETEVEKSLKYEIEQDKFCSRKIIIDCNRKKLTDDELMRSINNQLFNLKIIEKKDNHEDISLAAKIVKDSNAHLIELINDFINEGNQREKKEIIQSYLRKRMNVNEV